MKKFENIIAEYKVHTGKRGQMTMREMKLIEICFHHFVQNKPKIVVNVSGPTHSEVLKAANRIVKQYIKEDTPMLEYVKMKDVFKDAVKWLQDYQSACARGDISGKRPDFKNVLEQFVETGQRNVGIGCNNERYILERDFAALLDALAKAACASDAVDTVAEDGHFSCWINLGGGEQCKELCNKCSAEPAQKSSEGQR